MRPYEENYWGRSRYTFWSSLYDYHTAAILDSEKIFILLYFFFSTGISSFSSSGLENVQSLRFLFSFSHIMGEFN